MKFLKLRLFTALLFVSVISLVLYSSCERNVCDNVTCFNGGSCNNGGCNCPVGYDGAQCQTLSVDRFVGTYYGTHECINNNRPGDGVNVLDTVYITRDATKINFVDITIKSLSPLNLRGYTDVNSSTYSIVIPTDSAANYLNVVTVTLQNNVDLNIHLYQTSIASGDTSIQQCTYTLTKH